MYMTASVSTRKLIREMGSRELELHLIEIWNKFNKNTGLMLLNHPDIKLISDTYRQLTAGSIFYNISEEFTADYKKIISGPTGV